MNLKSEDLQALMTRGETEGCYFDETLPNGIGVETLAVFFHDLSGVHALIQVWDPRDKKPFWRFVLVYQYYGEIEIIKTFDDRLRWNRGDVPYVEVGKIVDYWRHFGHYDAPVQ